MRHLVACRIPVLGLVALCAVSFRSVALNAADPESEHVLFQAVRRGDAALLKDLLRRGTPPDIRDRDGSTPLMAAALHGSAEMVALLLEHGADPGEIGRAHV